MENSVIKSLEKIQEIIKDNKTLQFESMNIMENNSFYDLEDIKKELKRLEDEKRKIKIGIVGKVKAGKSTLLNSLFFNHQDILPKAATPMTAALTEISYGEELKFTVNYFTKEDIQTIKNNAEKYMEFFTKEFENEKKKLQEEFKRKNREYKLENDEILKKKIKNWFNKDYNFLVASYEHYEKIKNSNISIDSINSNIEIEVNNFEELKNKIYEYVGAKGDYMPFTKSIKIYLNFPGLKKYDIIDTPGLNDPIISRSQRTKSLLKECDVIFIVSQSGEFLTSEDRNLIKNLIETNAINNIYCIASKIDDQLFGGEYIGKDFENNLKDIQNKLQQHAEKVLNTKDIVLSSGMAENIYHDFKRKDIEGSEEKHIFDNLVRAYPNSFSYTNEEKTKNNLRKISNIKNIEEKLEIVELEKEKIVKDRIELFLKTIQTNFYRYKQLLIEKIEDKINTINNTDKTELEIKFNKLKDDKNKIYSTFNVTYMDLIEEIILRIRKDLTKLIDEENESIKSTLSSLKKVRTESYQVKSSGLISKIKRGLGIGGYETVNERVEYLDTLGINHEILVIKNKVENNIETLYSEILLKLKKDLSEIMVRSLTENLSIDVIDDNEVKLSIRRTVEKLEFPEIEFNNNPNNLLTINTELRKEIYISELYNYLNDFFDFYSKNVKNITNEINKLKNVNPLEKIFNDIETDLNNLIWDLENKEKILQIYENIKEIN